VSLDVGRQPHFVIYKSLLESEAGSLLQVRKDAADRYLRSTGISLTHLARELGYAEQSVLTRSCKRWFGTGPAAYRNQTRTPVKSRALSG